MIIFEIASAPPISRVRVLVNCLQVHSLRPRVNLAMYTLLSNLHSRSQPSETVEGPPASATSHSASKSTLPLEFAVTPLVSLKNAPPSPAISTLSLPAYRAFSPSPPTYVKPRDYLTIDDLYMKYAPLKHIRSSYSTRPRVTLPVMTMQDLFEKFREKTPLNTAKAGFNPAKWTKKPLALANSPAEYSIATPKSTANTPFLAIIKSDAQQPSLRSSGQS